MANHVITNYETAPQNTVSAANELIETYLETVVNTQVILDIGVTKHGDQYIGWVFHRT